MLHNLEADTAPVLLSCSTVHDAAQSRGSHTNGRRVIRTCVFLSSSVCATGTLRLASSTCTTGPAISSRAISLQQQPSSQLTAAYNSVDEASA